MTIRDFVSALSSGYFDEKLHELYGSSDNEMLRNRIRFIDACEHFSKNYPKCDKIRVYSVPAKITVGGVQLFLTADKIMIKGDGFNADYISDEIPKGFEKADLNENTSILDCFSGYSLCISGINNRKPYDEIPDTYSEDFVGSIAELRKKYTEREIFRIAVCCDEKKRNQLEYDVLMRGDVPEFFRLVNNSSMHTLCTSKTKTAVLLSRKFLDGDGAVTAENNMIKAFVPSYLAKDYKKIMSSVLGEGKSHIMQIRYTGGFEFTI